MSFLSDHIFYVSPGEKLTAEMHNRIRERVRANFAGGHTHSDGIASVLFDKNDQEDPDAILFWNDDVHEGFVSPLNETIPAFACIVPYYAWQISQGAPEQSTPIHVAWPQWAASGDLWSSAYQKIPMVNGREPVEVGKVGRGYAVSPTRPRWALYDYDQFGTPSIGDIIGPLPNSWQLGPGVPGQLVCVGIYGEDGRVLVTRDIYSHGSFTALTNERIGVTIGRNYCESHVTHNPVSSGIVYDGVTNTPEIPLDCDSFITQEWESNGYPLFEINIGEDNEVLGYYRASAGGGPPHIAIRGAFGDDPELRKKLWGGAGAGIPEGWSDDGGSIAGYTVIVRDG
jgi:hypothetical protein